MINDRTLWAVYSTLWHRWLEESKFLETSNAKVSENRFPKWKSSNELESIMLNISIRLFGQNGWRVVAIYFRFFLLGTTLLNNNDWTIDADDVILNRCGCVKWFNQIFCYPGKYVPTSTFKVKDSIVVIIPCGCLYSLYRDWSLEMVKEANIM